jgi:hypothetical protein
VLAVKCLRAPPGIFVAADEFDKGSGRGHLRASEQIRRDLLNLAPVQVSGLILEVKQEPQLDAWITDRDADLRHSGELQCPVHVGMLVDVEHTPVLVIGIPLSALGGTEISGSLGGSRLDELQRRPMKLIDYDDHTLPVRPVPVRQIDRLGLIPSVKTRIDCRCAALDLPGRLGLSPRLGLTSAHPPH